MAAAVGLYLSLVAWPAPLGPIHFRSDDGVDPMTLGIALELLLFVPTFWAVSVLNSIQEKIHF